MVVVVPGLGAEDRVSELEGSSNIGAQLTFFMLAVAGTSTLVLYTT